MDRRTAIRKAFGLSVAAAAMPLIPVEASNSQVCATGCPIDMPVPPPPDTRTPEEITADYDKEVADDAIRHITREPDPWSKRYPYTLYIRDFEVVVAAVAAQGIPHTRRMVNGFDSIIGSNGNFVRTYGQRIYLH